MNDNECPICFEQKESIHKIECSHTICLSCIINIYKRNKCFNCPTCRKAINISTINNAYFLESIGLFNESVIFTPFNTNRCNTEDNIKIYKKYIIVLPKKNILLLVQCTYKALLAADMEILAVKKNDRFLSDSIDCTIGYIYSNYNKIYFDSFLEHDDCLVYN